MSHSAPNAAATHAASESPPSDALLAHYHHVVLPIWRNHGFNPLLGLPFEAVLADGTVPEPVRYRAMACARQLFVFSEAGDQAHAQRLFKALKDYFHDPRQGGFFYSVTPSGLPHETDKDLYTHAFVIFACAVYFQKFADPAAFDLMNDTAEIVATRFSIDPATGLSNAAMSDDFTTARLAARQNPLMHLSEAYLAALDAGGDSRYDKALTAVLDGLSAHFIDPVSHCMMELPQDAAESWIEPGHQFEWLFLAQSSRHAAFESSGLNADLLKAFDFAERHGIDHGNSGVVASLDRRGAVLDGTQRIWAQTEYLRAMAYHPDSAVQARTAKQAKLFRNRFLHDAGWHECIGADGVLSRLDMPSTTAYHLISSYSALTR